MYGTIQIYKLAGALPTNSIAKSKRIDIPKQESLFIDINISLKNRSFCCRKRSIRISIPISLPNRFGPTIHMVETRFVDSRVGPTKSSENFQGTENGHTPGN